MKAHLLFEQSGTFKKAFQKYGIEAEDYDIQNDFGETDHQIDLFQEIRGGYNGDPSIFDNFGEDDIVMAFFPCIRFEASILLSFRGQSKQMRDWSPIQKMEYCMKLQDELTEMYRLINMLFIVCIKKKIKLIVENPYSEEHYLRRYWCIPATLVDKDRRLRGDYYKKPTQYWFVNCEPKYNIIFEALSINAIQSHANDSVRWISAGVFERETGIKCSQKVARSMIHPDYADRFIREYIL